MRKEVKDIMDEVSRKLFQKFLDAKRRNDKELEFQIQEVKRSISEIEGRI